MQPRRRASPSPALLAILATGSAPAAELPAQQISADLLATIDFRSIGPTRQSGRFVDIAVHEQEPWTFYMATASGHLWKTINNGVTFEPVFTDEAVFSIGDLAVAPSDPDILYLVLCSQSLFRFADLGDDGLCRGDPDKGCGVIVAAIGVVVDRSPTPTVPRQRAENDVGPFDHALRCGPFVHQSAPSACVLLGAT